MSVDGSQFVLPTSEARNFAVKVLDLEDLVFSKVNYTVAGARNVAGNLERDAELQLNINGSSFMRALLESRSPAVGGFDPSRHEPKWKASGSARRPGATFPMSGANMGQAQDVPSASMNEDFAAEQRHSGPSRRA